MSPVLEARELAKRYSAFTAVRDVSFSIRPGEILGVLGPNGSGKSTIVKMVTGLLDPSRGAVLFRGERIGQELTAFKRTTPSARTGQVIPSFGHKTAWRSFACPTT